MKIDKDTSALVAAARGFVRAFDSWRIHPDTRKRNRFISRRRNLVRAAGYHKAL